MGQQRVDPAGTTYDLQSIMHYEPTAFSKNGRPTIISKSGETSFGNTEEPTQTEPGIDASSEGPDIDGSGEGSGIEYLNVDYPQYENVYNDYGTIFVISEYGK